MTPQERFYETGVILPGYGHKVPEWLKERRED